MINFLKLPTAIDFTVRLPQGGVYLAQRLPQIGINQTALTVMKSTSQ
jgi:hypothetical protein